MSEASARMSAEERRTAVSLAGIFSFRMLGLFMILPVFSLYAQGLEGITPTLVGVAIGIYGLTQALLQIPFGMASDHLGRKPVITAGLLVFALGSVVAAMATTIEGVIVGRALQGAGAVAAAIMALAADLTREEHRTKAMAIIGMSIGMSFLVAMVAGPVLNTWVGVPGIFWLTAGLAVAGIAVLYLGVPAPARLRTHRDTEPALDQFKRVLADSQLLRLDIGVMVLHLVLTAGFVVLPLALRDAGLLPADHWVVYLPVMILAMAAAVPFIVIAEKRRMIKQVAIGAVSLLAIAEIGLYFMHGSVPVIAVLLWLFFAAFNLMEATMPSLIAKMAPVESKGTAMGVFSSSQFFGAFVGGTAGGWLYGQFGYEGVFLFSALLIGLWWMLLISMREPRYLSTRLLPVGDVDPVNARLLERELAAVVGVAEVAVNVEDGVAYLKVDSQTLDVAALSRFSAAEARGF